MIWKFRVKIKHKKTGTILFNRKVEGRGIVGAVRKAAETMLTDGLLRKRLKEPMKIGSHWWMWTRAKGLEVTITRLEVLEPKGMK